MTPNLLAPMPATPPMARCSLEQTQAHRPGQTRRTHLCGRRERNRSRAGQSRTHRQRGRASISGGTDRCQVGCGTSGLAITDRAPQRAEGSRPPRRRSDRGIQSAQQHPRVERTAGERTTAHRDEQSTHLGAGAHRGRESAARSSQASAAFQGRRRRLSGGNTIPDHHRPAQSICRSDAPRGRANDFARIAPPGDTRNPGRSRAPAACDKRRGQSHRSHRPHRI